MCLCCGARGVCVVLLFFLKFIVFCCAVLDGPPSKGTDQTNRWLVCGMPVGTEGWSGPVPLVGLPPSPLQRWSRPTVGWSRPCRVQPTVGHPPFWLQPVVGLDPPPRLVWSCPLGWSGPVPLVGLVLPLRLVRYGAGVVRGATLKAPWQVPSLSPARPSNKPPSRTCHPQSSAW
jgi:hypothetical protein